MKKIYTLILSASISVAVIAQPVITSFTPASGPIGTTITISGTGFGTTASANIVFFGGAKAIVTAATASSITVTVPVEASSEYISVTNFTNHLTTYSNKPFHVTFPGCNSGITSSTFAPEVDFTPGGHPVGITIGDVDGDRRVDLAVVNAYDNTVSIFLNTSSPGAITFAAKVDFAVGTYPYAVALGDMDGDGKLDIAVANGNSDDVSVLRNTCTAGTASFAPKIDYTAGVEPYSVAIGDLNTDGKPDLAVANFDTPGLVSVYANTSTVGSLAFSPKADFGTGGHPKSVSIGDIDNDGKPDLTLSDFNTAVNTISVLRNTSATGGTIAFALSVDFPTGTNPYFIGLGDLDGDGKTDVSVPNNGDNTFSVLRNTSTPGIIAFAAKVDFATDNSPVTVVVEDLDGDGKLDVTIENQFSNNVSVFRNTSTTGSISFSPKVDFTTSGTPYGMAIGDLDGDQRPDIATANAGLNDVSTIRNLECPVGIITNDFPSSEIKVYPNPMVSQITIEINNFKNENYELHLYNLLGAEVLNTVITNEQTIINRNELPSGIYFIQIRSEKEIIANEKLEIGD